MNKDFLKKYITAMLGSSQVSVELSENDLDMIIYHAINYYMQYSNYAFNEEWKVIRLTANVALQEVPDDVDFIIYINNSGGSVPMLRIPNDVGTTYETNMLAMMLNDNAINSVNNHMPSSIIYKEGKRYFQVDPIPKDDINVAAKVLTYKDLSALYGDSWIQRYSVALAKIVLGNIRSKYSGISSPNDITMNGTDLVSQAQTEMQNLEQELWERDVIYSGGIWVG